MSLSPLVCPGLSVVVNTGDGVARLKDTMPATRRELHINLGPPSPVPYALPGVRGLATPWITYSADYIENDTPSVERGSPVDVYTGYLGSPISTVKSSLWATYCVIQAILFGGNTTAD